MRARGPRLTSLLLHSEYTIRDGVLCHSAQPCAGVLDPEGPGGAAAMCSAVPQAQALCGKFGGSGVLGGVGNGPEVRRGCHGS